MEHTKIYFIHNGDNTPFYIGKSNRPQGRVGHHRKNFGENITLEIIDKVPLNEWKFWETYWIEQFKSWGFDLKNKNKGGGGATKQNFSSQRNKKIAKANMGMSKSHKGKPLSEEHKAAIKKTRGFLKDREVTWLSQPVLQYDLDGNFIKEFASQTEAQYIMGKPNSDGIGACCRGNQKTAYGYKWKYK